MQEPKVSVPSAAASAPQKPYVRQPGETEAEWRGRVTADVEEVVYDPVLGGIRIKDKALNVAARHILATDHHLRRGDGTMAQASLDVAIGVLKDWRLTPAERGDKPSAPPPAPVAQPSQPPAPKAWEQEMVEGWHVGYCDMKEERNSAKGAYTMFVFRVEAGGLTGRYTYYIGHRRAEENAATKKRLALNPHCWLRLIKKQNVRGMVIEELDMTREVPAQ